MKSLVTISGPPRTGSTVLSHLLNQNPIFTLQQNTNLAEIIDRIRIYAKDEIKNSQIPHKQLEKQILNFCRWGANSWINDVCPAEILLDKSRYWLYQYQFMFKVFPEMKMILHLRDLRFVVNSFEKRNAESLSVDFRNNYYCGFDTNFMKQRVDDILDFWFLKDTLISIKELLDTAPKCRKNILLFRYEDMINHPQDSLNKVYDFLSIPRYNHDFNHIEDKIRHNDNIYQPYGDHTIKSKLEKSLPKHCSHISEDMSDYIIKKHMWYYEEFYPEILK